MSAESGKTFFIALALIMFLGCMWLISGGEWNPTLIAAVPIIGGAELMVFGMVYATTFHGASDGQPH